MGINYLQYGPTMFKLTSKCKFWQNHFFKTVWKSRKNRKFIPKIHQPDPEGFKNSQNDTNQRPPENRPKCPNWPKTANFEKKIKHVKIWWVQHAVRLCNGDNVGSKMKIFENVRELSKLYPKLDKNDSQKDTKMEQKYLNWSPMQCKKDLIVSYIATCT